MTYEITDKDKEEYEKRIKLFPKVISNIFLLTIYLFIYLLDE